MATTGAELLKDWMARRQLNQEEAAELFGLDPSFVSHMVRGARIPSLANAVKIAALSGIPVESWTTSAEDNAVAEAVGAGAKPKRDKRSRR